LSSISQSSPAFAAIVTNAIADNTQSAIASNQSRVTANIFLKNLIGAASAAGVTFGDLGAPSAGELAQISGNLSAALNAALLGITLASYEQSLGFPDLSLQVLANTEGLSQTDAITAAIGGSRYGDALSNPLSVLFLKQSLTDNLVLQSGLPSQTAAIIVNNAVNNLANSGVNFVSAEALIAALQGQFVQQGVASNVAALLAAEGLNYINALLGVPGLNQVTPGEVPPGSNPSAVVNDIIDINRRILATLEKYNNVLNEVLKNIQADREKIAEILKAALLSDILNGKSDINFQLRDSAVAALRSAGYSTKLSLYLANQLIRRLTGNQLSPITGITADKLNQLVEADKGISQSAIAEALASGPFSSEIAFTNTLRGILERSGGGLGLDQALAGLSDVKVMDKDELKKSLSTHLDGVLTGLSAANAVIARDNILKGILDDQNPTSIVSQVKDQIDTLNRDRTEREREDIHRQFVEDLRTFLRPSAVLGYAITSMQDHAALPLSVAAAAASQGQTDILTGSRG
jgi:hypothetical protein